MTTNDELNILAAQALGQTRDLVATLNQWQALAKQTGKIETIFGMPADTLHMIIRNLGDRVIERGEYLTGDAVQDDQVVRAIRYPNRGK